MLHLKKNNRVWLINLVINWNRFIKISSKMEGNGKSKSAEKHIKMFKN